MPGVAARPIGASGETLPAVGLGSWITFNVGNDRAARAACADVVRAFFEAGGRMIDSSPMYGSAQAVIGEALARIGPGAPVFAADKVWISSGARGPEQIEESRRLWKLPRFDLLQVHNLLGWEAHLPTLFAMRAAGRLRYVGITTSEGRRHREIEAIMRSQPIDFVQISYNLLDREVEERILPLARERGIAVIVNRPFREGALLRSLPLAGIPLLLVGPASFRSERLRRDFHALTAMSGVQWVGGVPREQVASYLRAIDVGVTPYADTAFNRRSYPLKTVEYLAAGVPVVSSTAPPLEDFD
ncbi:MAG TPA: aldo/keto reductase, partial [Burkholderiaceae bacterium]|nr:aldo/keto reductase [Burkholderiaceae bacterium]